MSESESQPHAQDARLRSIYTDWTLLGRGSRGESWRSVNAVTGQHVVIKVRPRDHNSEDMARREARAMTSVASPHLQRFQEMCASDDQLYLIYDFVDGRTLRETLDDGPLPWTQAISVMRPVLMGLGALHTQGLIHRDVSPENIVLRDNGRDAVLIDFDAFGQLEAKTRIGETTVGVQFAGKLAYMSAEQVAGAPQSTAVDIWGAGAVLFECLTGYRLQQGMSPSEVVALSQRPPDLSEVPPGFRPILARMLAVDPGARPGVAEVLADLETLLDGARIGTENWVEEADPPAASAPTGRKSRVGVLGWLMALAVVILAGGALAMLVLSGGTLSEPPLDPETLRAAGFVILGLTVALLGYMLAGVFRARARSTELALPFQAIDLIQAPDARTRLSETICMGIDAYRAMAGPASEEMLTVTMVALAKEYAEAETADTRLKALTMLNELHAKISRSLRPWWLNHEKVIATGISLTSLVAGAVAAIEGVGGLF